MSESVLNRREARRRKILENAKSRLDKLSGSDSGASLLNNIGCNNHSTETYSDPEIEHPEFINNYSSPYTTRTETTPNHVDWSSSPLLSNPTKTPPTKFEKFLSTRLHILASSALTYLMLVFGLSAFIPHSLFLFMTLECLELVAFRLDRPLSPIENIVLMLCGVNMSKAKILIKIVGLLNKLVCDLGMFVFVFAMTHGLYSWFLGDAFNEMFHSF